jgi:hypothetical protein
MFTGKDGGIIHFTEITGEEACSTYASEKFLRNLQQSYTCSLLQKEQTCIQKYYQGNGVKILQCSHKSQCHVIKE